MSKSKINLNKYIFTFILFFLIISIVYSVFGFADASSSNEENWITGDFHTHTYLSDGSHSQQEIMKKAYDKYNLDCIAISDHGGTKYNNFFRKIEVLLRDYSQANYFTSDFNDAISNYYKAKYSNKQTIQGLEWNVPSYEHANITIIPEKSNDNDLNDFEYIYDEWYTDTDKKEIIKKNKTYSDAIDGLKYLQKNYKDRSYFIINHPSRKLKYSISDIRDFHNVAPDIFLGLEGIPGHQKASNRGGYNKDFGDKTYKARTYGGVDYMVAKIGGLWDALLGEGRKIWVFGNSDFHNTKVDFWPGEYVKNHIYVENINEIAIIDGMRSGKSFVVQGDLINALDFNISYKNNLVNMGNTILINKNQSLEITIRFKSPSINNNGDKVEVDHIDLIVGDITDRAKPEANEYYVDTNNSTKIIKTFTKKDLNYTSNGWYEIKYKIDKLDQDKYFRLRGTNLPPNTINETDKYGNPLCDDLAGKNNINKAYNDLWFYSNPIFVEIIE